MSKDLDPLPSNKDKFWDKAEMHEFRPRKVSCNDKEHSFIRKNNEAKCIRCPIGFGLGIGAIVKDEHIYINDTFVV